MNKKKIKLYGFNNLTKNVNICIYDIFYNSKEEEKIKYIKYIDEKYNSKILKKILKNICNIIGAKILNIAQQDYEPQGSSVTLLISEELIKKTILSHLDKSHICVHTYPENHPQKKICTFRIDIEISTCGLISPLKSINYIINKINPLLISIDYKIRGFTRDIKGEKYYIDHKINSIQNYINKSIKKKYDIEDTNIYQENIFHTKMIKKNINYELYTFNTQKTNQEKKNKITLYILKEMNEIFYNKK